MLALMRRLLGRRQPPPAPTDPPEPVYCLNGLMSQEEMRRSYERYLRENQKDTYSVMADCGVGEFLWRKEGEYLEPGVGANVYSLMDAGCQGVPSEMSQALFAEFCEWAKWYMSGLPENYANPMNLDWDAFNREGLRLAKRLKVELGETAHVRYVRAWDDPDRDRDRYTLIEMRDALAEPNR